MYHIKNFIVGCEMLCLRVVSWVRCVLRVEMKNSLSKRTKNSGSAHHITQPSPAHPAFRCLPLGTNLLLFCVVSNVNVVGFFYVFASQPHTTSHLHSQQFSNYLNLLWRAWIVLYGTTVYNNINIGIPTVISFFPYTSIYIDLIV